MIYGESAGQSGKHYKLVLTGSLHCTFHQLAALGTDSESLAINYWCSYFYRTYTSCYINNGEEGTDSVARKMVQDIK
jgi:hypothetical protein